MRRTKGRTQTCTKTSTTSRTRSRTKTCTIIRTRGRTMSRTKGRTKACTTSRTRSRTMSRTKGRTKTCTTSRCISLCATTSCSARCVKGRAQCVLRVVYLSACLSVAPLQCGARRWWCAGACERLHGVSGARSSQARRGVSPLPKGVQPMGANIEARTGWHGLANRVLKFVLRVVLGVVL